MAEKQAEKTLDARMNPAALYREEIFSDRKVGTIRCLTPVKVDGSADPTRATLFVGQTQVLTAMGALPLSFEIDATNLEDAVAKFAAGAKGAFERTVRELEEYRRQSASSIVIPDRGAGGFGPGGLPGGGKLQIP